MFGRLILVWKKVSLREGETEELNLELEHKVSMSKLRSVPT